ncbi:MAG: AmmeMemoRadiSam system radical SAM enzyme [archaeon]
MHEAMFYTKEEELVKCTLCPHNCRIPDGKSGICAVRKNCGGKLYSEVYGKSIAYHIDPIEKKPLFHFFPGEKIFSFATAGCNFKCDFCQNWDISQISKGKSGQIIGEEFSPKEIARHAVLSGCKSIAMTYNEPTIFFEYAYDTCIEAKKHDIKTVFVSNGFINKAPINKISKVLDAINIDLKSYSEDFYKRVCGGKLEPVLNAIKEYHKQGVWVEITTLVIPGQNDSEEELKRIAGFIASVDKNIPWHISRFHPDYKMTRLNATPIETLEMAYKIGKKAGLNFVYVGNVASDYENTYCPKCEKLLIEREGYLIKVDNINKGKCKFCSNKIAGIF